ncbi:MAG: HEPN domain-containing protein [Treponema sp.]
MPKTHDLALLADMLSEKFEIDEFIYNACSDLTPYGVKIRYPKEIYVDEAMAQKALNDMNTVCEWCKEKIFL